MTEFNPTLDAYYDRWVRVMGHPDAPMSPQSLHYGYSADPNDFSDRLAAKFATSEQVAQELRRTGTQDPATIADLGCGTGGPAEYMSEVAFPTSRILAVNVFLAQLELMKRLGHTSDRVEPVHADFSNLPFEGQSLDGAYAIESSCHAVDKPAFFQGVLHCLRPGRSLVLTDVFDKRERRDTQEEKAYQRSMSGWAVPNWHTVPETIPGATVTFHELTPHMMPDITASKDAAVARLTRDTDPVERSHSEAIVNMHYCLEQDIVQYGLMTITKQ